VYTANGKRAKTKPLQATIWAPVWNMDNVSRSLGRYPMIDELYANGIQHYRAGDNPAFEFEREWRYSAKAYYDELEEGRKEFS